jgi:hypothetical protein
MTENPFALLPVYLEAFRLLRAAPATWECK